MKVLIAFGLALVFAGVAFAGALPSSNSGTISAYVPSVVGATSTVIVQASQAEQNTLTTRRVANHNHCHALTIQYYEVLRHYRVTTT